MLTINKLGVVASLVAGSTIFASDEAAYKQSMAAGKGVQPQEFTVERVTSITANEGLATWNCAYLSSGGILMEKIVDNLVDYYLYDSVNFPFVNRVQALERGLNWLFKQPANPDSFEVNSLEYAVEINYNSEGGEKVFSIKDQGELTGSAIDNPKRKGVDNLIGTVVEYQSQDGAQVLVLEIGEPSDNGGLIQLFSGRLIEKADLKILNR
jgi:hypothetical protein